MPFYFFIWTEQSIAKIAEHGVTAEEFQEVVCQPDSTDFSRSSGRPIATGRTSTGKTLCCVYELIDDDTVDPVTAYEVEGN